jgi:ketosteroid isomerase-like protein
VAEHPNAVIVRKLLDGLRRGDLTAFDEAVSPDLAWHFPGRSGALAGTHRGREEVLAFFARVLQLTDATFAMDVIDVIAGDDRAVVLFRGRAVRGGRQLDNPTCLSMRVQDGRITELWEFVWDLYDVDEFWS